MYILCSVVVLVFGSIDRSGFDYLISIIILSSWRDAPLEGSCQ